MKAYTTLFLIALISSMYAARQGGEGGTMMPPMDSTMTGQQPMDATMANQQGPMDATMTGQQGPMDATMTGQQNPMDATMTGQQGPMPMPNNGPNDASMNGPNFEEEEKKMRGQCETHCHPWGKACKDECHKGNCGDCDVSATGVTCKPDTKCPQWCFDNCSQCAICHEQVDQAMDDMHAQFNAQKEHAMKAHEEQERQKEEANHRRMEGVAHRMMDCAKRTEQHYKEIEGAAKHAEEQMQKECGPRCAGGDMQDCDQCYKDGQNQMIAIHDPCWNACAQGFCHNDCRACEDCNENGCPTECSGECQQRCKGCPECVMDMMRHHMEMSDPCFGQCGEGWCYQECQACEHCDENGCPPECSQDCQDNCKDCGQCHEDVSAISDPCWDQCDQGMCYDECLGCISGNEKCEGMCKQHCTDCGQCRMEQHGMSHHAMDMDKGPHHDGKHHDDKHHDGKHHDANKQGPMGGTHGAMDGTMPSMDGTNKIDGKQCQAHEMPTGKFGLCKGDSDCTHPNNVCMDGTCDEKSRRCI